MDWVLNNLDNVIIPIIIMVLYGLGSAAQKKDQKKKKEQRSRQQQADPNEARRVREIQEEIRRKIADRTGRTPPPIKKPTRAQPVQMPPQSPGRKRTILEKPHGLPEHSQKYSDEQRGSSSRPTRQPQPQPVFETDTYEREIEEKMRQVRKLEAQAKRRTLPPPLTRHPRPKVAAGELRTQLYKDLSHPLGLRKAVLVSEILGSPVGIKGPSHWKSNV